MKLIPLTQGQFTAVDDEDFERFKHLKFQAKKYPNSFYAAHGKRVDGKVKTFNLHRMIMNCPDGMEVDHIDGNGLNNQKSNLRICTSTENRRNRKINQSKRGTGYKGITFHKKSSKWMSRIQIGTGRLTLGFFENPIDAAKAYDLAALQYHGEFACLNFQ